MANFNIGAPPVSHSLHKPRTAARPRKRARSKGSLPLFLASLTGVFIVFAGYFLITPYLGSPKTPAPSAHEEATGASKNPALGKIVVGEGTGCRNLEFDNATGGVRDTATACAGPAQSGSAPRAQYQMPGNRLDTIRKSFAK